MDERVGRARDYMALHTGACKYPSSERLPALRRTGEWIVDLEPCRVRFGRKDAAEERQGGAGIDLR